MNTQKIVYKYRNHKQWIHRFILENRINTMANVIYSSRRFIWCQGLKALHLRTIRKPLNNRILHILELSANPLVGIRIQIAMQLQYNLPCQIDILVIFVYRIQHIAIPHNLFLIPITRHHLIRYQRPNPSLRRHNPFNPVRRLHTLHLRNIYQPRYTTRPLRHKQILSPLILMNLRHQRHNLTIPQTILEPPIIKTTHTAPPFP
ncbi:hypothetical protein HMPREF1151_0397 [Veillonella sp. ACP1]|nr:hypothetical protein HMPREF1151_0397 [Veillonella sp. ACP1]